jgi:hypothetical protein
MSAPNNQELSDAELNRIKKEREQFTIVLNTITNMVERTRGIKDPATRNCMFVDKLCLIIDVGMGFLQSQATFQEDRELKMKAYETISVLKSQLEDLFTWLETPSYNPNHPFGNIILKQAEDDFKLSSERKS